MADLMLIPSSELIIEDKYKAALFIPHNSSLSQEDISRIRPIITWEKNLNELSGIVFSGRSVIISKESSNAGLQISGVGYLPVNIGINNDASVGYEGDVFQMPGNKNFLDEAASRNHQGNIMGWTSPSSKKTINGVNYYELINHHSKYKPAGTYEYGELSRKVRRTSMVSGLKLKDMIIPKVEAYGYYLSDELKNSNGPFGFIVTTTPGKDKERFMQEISSKKSGLAELIGGLSKLAIGLRELHDNGYCHLQPHASNFYLVNNKPYLMDWSTAEKLGSNKELNLLYRAVDLSKLLNNLESIVRIAGFTHESLLAGMSIILGSYAGANADLVELANKAGRYKNKPDDFDVTLQLLLKHNVESFADIPKKILVKKSDESLDEFIKNNRIRMDAPKRMNKYERARQKK